jgi:hypothetical protein
MAKMHTSSYEECLHITLQSLLQTWIHPRAESGKNDGTMLEKTYGLRRCELPFRITSTPPLPAAAMTLFFAPKSTPTTDMIIFLFSFLFMTEAVNLICSDGWCESKCFQAAIGGEARFSSKVFWRRG